MPDRPQRTPLPPTPWWNYVNGYLVALRWTKTDLARAARLERSLVSRWEEGAQPTAPTIRAVAHALGRPVAEAVVCAGQYTADEIGVRTVPVDIRTVPDADLAREVYRRFVVGRAAAEPRRLGAVIDVATPTPSGDVDITFAGDLDAADAGASESNAAGR